MNKYIIILILTFVFSNTLFSAELTRSENVLKKRIHKYVRSVEYFNGLKPWIKRLTKIVKPGSSISSQLSDDIKHQYMTFINIQDELKKNWNDYNKLLEYKLPKDMKTKSEIRKDLLTVKIAGLGVISRIRQFHNSYQLIKIAKDNRTLRDKLNELASYTNSSFEDIFSEFSKLKNQDGILKASNKFINMYNERLKNNSKLKEDDDLLYIITEINNSDVLKVFSNRTTIKKIAYFFSIILDEGWYNTVNAYKSLKSSISKFFGNTVGSFKSKRKPYVNIDKTLPEMLKILKPGDILLEKTGFLLTDKFIPGHFGHAAIYSGKPKELFKTILNKDKPEIVKYLEKLSKKEKKSLNELSNNEVLEALRPGITIHSLKHFLHVDDVAVLRIKKDYKCKYKIDENYIRKVLAKGFSYLATDYDFAFDVNSSEKIVCSEMPYQCFTAIPFRVNEVMGSWTIGPDDVAVGAGNTSDRPFELVYFSHEGKTVPKNKMLKKYISILNSEGSVYDQYPNYNNSKSSSKTKGVQFDLDNKLSDEYQW